MKQRVTLNDKTFEVMIPAEEIDKAVAAVAERLNSDYASTDKAPIFVGVLNGSYMFLADLVRKTTFNNEITFVQISSYEGTQSTGTIKQKLGIDFDIEGRDVIIVEDIVETGHSINHMINYINSLNPNSVEICTLFFKPEKYLYELPIKYRAMEIDNEFIVGYGLDYDQLGRNLKDIYVLANDSQRGIGGWSQIATRRGFLHNSRRGLPRR